MSLRKPIDRACDLLARAQRARDDGRPARALALARRALRLFERHDGPRSGDAANTLCEISGALVDLGRYAVAVARARRAVDIVGGTRQGGVVAQLRHHALSTLGHASVLSGDYTSARAAFDRARRTAEAHLNDTEVASAHTGLGMCAKYLGRWSAGLRHYARALLIARRKGTSAWELEATILHNLGGIEHARGRFARAERWARAGVELRRRHVATGVPLAADVAALAAIVHARGRLDEAGSLYASALRVFRRRLGPQHFEVAFNMAQLAALEHDRGRLRRGTPALSACSVGRSTGVTPFS